MLRWISRIFGGLAAIVALGLVALVITHASWMADRRRVLATGSEIAHTARGDIEYAVAGRGIPVLRVHGSPGGYDQTIASARARPADYAGYQIIAVSRPGFLRTPLSSGRTPAEQADLYAALLDELGIQRTIVYGASGGGPSALQFAIRHPERTLGLVLVVPHLHTTPAEELEPAPSGIGMYLQDLAFWTGVQAGPSVTALFMRGFDADDPLEVLQMRETGLSFIPWDARVTGRNNDRAQYQHLGIESWPLESVTVPTLILHGTDDENAPYLGSARVAARMPNARLITFPGGDHLIIVTRARELRDLTRSFMQSLPQAP